MAVTFKVLGQANPSSGVLTDLYTVPGATSSTDVRVIICNQSSRDATFRISIAVAGAADATKQYIYYDTPVPANDTFIAVLGITLATTDVVRCYSKDSTQLSFGVFGAEVS